MLAAGHDQPQPGEVGILGHGDESGYDAVAGAVVELVETVDTQPDDLIAGKVPQRPGHVVDEGRLLVQCVRGLAVAVGRHGHAEPGDAVIEIFVQSVGEGVQGGGAVEIDQRMEEPVRDRGPGQFRSGERAEQRGLARAGRADHGKPAGAAGAGEQPLHHPRGFQTGGEVVGHRARRIARGWDTAGGTLPVGRKPQPGIAFVGDSTAVEHAALR